MTTVPPTENSTDATQGSDLVTRARTRRAELVALLAELPEAEQRVRGDIELALSSVDELLTGDETYLSSVTAAALNTWLERNKYLAESHPAPPAPPPPVEQPEPCLEQPEPSGS